MHERHSAWHVSMEHYGVHPDDDSERWNFGPIVEASYAVFDGHGTITKLVSTDNFSSGGSFTVTGTGTYIVNPDCSGSLTFNTSAGTVNRHLEILDGDTVDFVHTDAGLIIAGTMKKRKQTRVRNTE